MHFQFCCVFHSVVSFICTYLAERSLTYFFLSAGESGLGKSTLVNSLFLTDLYPDRVVPSARDKIEKTVSIEAASVEILERGVKLRLTVVDTPGFGDALNTSNCFKSITQYVDAQFEKYLKDESGLNRRNIVDCRVHCCFYFINPAGHGLRPLDVKFMKELDRRVNIVPVIAKADTLTRPELIRLKRRVMDQIEALNIQIYPLPDCDDDEDLEYKEQCKQLKEAIPYAVIGSNTMLEVQGRKVRGRLYPWGVVEIENPDHSDFIKLRTMLVAHMQDLQEVTQDVHYENFRLNRLKTHSNGTASNVQNSTTEDRLTEKQLAEKDAELRRMQEMLVKMQAEMQAKSSAGRSVDADAPSAPTPASRVTSAAAPGYPSAAARNANLSGPGGASAQAPPPPPSHPPPYNSKLSQRLPSVLH